MIFTKADNTQLVTYASGINNAASPGGTDLSGYQRLYCIGVAPAAASNVILIARKYHTITGNLDSWMFLNRPFFGETGANVTTPQAWSSGAGTVISGDQIVTGSITANQIAAGTITAAKLGVTDLSAISANLGTISVTNANIANLTVGTGQITNNAVTAAVNSQGTPTQCGFGYYNRSGIGSAAPPVDGDTFTIGAEVYTFKTTPTLATHILITTAGNQAQFEQIAKTVNNYSTTYSLDTGLTSVTFASATTPIGLGLAVHMLASNTNSVGIASTWGSGNINITQTTTNVNGGSGTPIVGFGSLGTWASTGYACAGTSATRLTTAGEAILITGSFSTLFGPTTSNVECVIYRASGPPGAPAFSKQFVGNGTGLTQSSTIAAFDSGIANYSGLVEYRIVYRYVNGSGSNQHADAKAFDLTFLRVKK
jgi:hypothetical protein